MRTTPYSVCMWAFTSAFGIRIWNGRRVFKWRAFTPGFQQSWPVGLGGWRRCVLFTVEWEPGERGGCTRCSNGYICPPLNTENHTGTTTRHRYFTLWIVASGYAAGMYLPLDSEPARENRNSPCLRLVERRKHPVGAVRPRRRSRSSQPRIQNHPG